jgi:type I restriction enzyme R subunit
MNERFTEADFEQTLIELFQGMGYQYECGYDVERDFREPYYTEDLKRSLRKMNPLLGDDVLDEAFRIITHVNEGTLEQRNERMKKAEDSYEWPGQLLNAFYAMVDLS